MNERQLVTCLLQVQETHEQVLRCSTPKKCAAKIVTAILERLGHPKLDFEVDVTDAELQEAETAILMACGLMQIDPDYNSGQPHTRH